MAEGGPAAASECTRLARIASDGADHVCAYAGIGRWCDAAPDRGHPCHTGREATHRCRRQDGKARHARKHKYPGASSRRIESGDACHEVRSIGQIKVVNALGDTGFDDPILTLPIGLKKAT